MIKINVLIQIKALLKRTNVDGSATARKRFVRTGYEFNDYYATCDRLLVVEPFRYGAVSEFALADWIGNPFNFGGGLEDFWPATDAYIYGYPRRQGKAVGKPDGFAILSYADAHMALTT